MSDRFQLRLYCDAVFAAGCVIAALFARTTSLGYISTSKVAFAVLAGGVLLGEMLPVKIPRRGGDEEITSSSAFSLALLLAGGLAPALIAQCTASLIQDRVSGKPWWRVRFNVGQYALAMTAAVIALHLVPAGSQIGKAHPFRAAELPAIFAAASVFFLVNNGVVGVAVAMYQDVSLKRYFRNDAFFVVVTGGVMLLMAPLIVAATAYSVFLVPLFLAPMLAMYNTVWQGARSQYAARHDALTGLPNRTEFHHAVKDALKDSRPSSCVLLIDLDRFKEVNDTLGHRYGDMLLRQVAERFREQLGGEDHIARLGGDEFAILGRGRGRAAAVELARRVAASLKDPFELEEMIVDAQASVGIALFPQDGTDVETVLQKADVAMYRAKKTRSDVALYDERHDDHSPAKLALTVELRSAIEDDQVVLRYQPELDLATEKVVALEALVRWEHPALGLLMPSSFVDMAEHINLIKPLTQRVLDLSLGQLAQWRAMNIDVSVAVNISAHVLVDQGFVDRVLMALQNAGVPPTRLKLEVTESTLMVDPVLARSVLQALDGHGIEISIDDFGTGYSSLAYLAKLPVSEVKIDQSFVSRMAAGSSESIIVNSTIDLAHHLGLRAVAEGVEDLALLTDLRALGCDAAQGYAISRPLTGDSITQWLCSSQNFNPVIGIVRSAA
ncbi:MAG: putative bifunctional diguanylate cyclase/phosphodiesterase [Solirubrobacteraceae bacterium]